jgi:hypothetical protein
MLPISEFQVKTNVVNDLRNSTTSSSSLRRCDCLGSWRPDCLPRFDNSSH